MQRGKKGESMGLICFKKKKRSAKQVGGHEDYSQSYREPKQQHNRTKESCNTILKGGYMKRCKGGETPMFELTDGTNTYGNKVKKKFQLKIEQAVNGQEMKKQYSLAITIRLGDWIVGKHAIWVEGGKLLL